MDRAPENCDICGRPLRRLKHAMAHEGHFVCDSELRTCPHNLREARAGAPRHDEWHRSSHGWVKREPD